MAFLFKSKKNQDRNLSSRDGPPSGGSPQFGAGAPAGAGARLAREEKGAVQRSTPTASLNSIDTDRANGSPDQPFTSRRQNSADQGPGPAINGPQPPSDLPFRNSPPAQTSPNSSLYPWSQKRLTFTQGHSSPFPRYGAAVNSASSKDGDIYVMGGLINSQTVKGDLWIIEGNGSMSTYPLPTTAEGPGPRVGHSALLIGNAFIVFGGDTKIEDGDTLDETLYLLNTSTRQWSRALPAGPRPSGRYGHSLNILKSKIYVFGGQVEGYFMNDLAAFDLNQLQNPNNRWEMLIPNSDGAGAQAGKIPPARTNHSVITYNEKMYLFGGTDGFRWFNDVWCYDSNTNLWSQLDCIGYIPVAREGHAAALVDDVMYIFGGRTEEGADLGDLAAFRITSRRWYTFQNMGPSPSPRSGHSMTTVGKTVVVVGGEPSSAQTAVNDLGLSYLLDTSKIRYPPNDSQPAAQKTQAGSRRPSQSEGPQNPALATRNLPSRDGSQGPPDPKKLIASREGRTESPNGFRGLNGGEVNGQPATGSKGPRGPPPVSLPPSGPPPQGQPPKPSVATTSLGRVRGASADRGGDYSNSPVNQSPITRDPAAQTEAPVNGRRTPTQQPVAPQVAASQPVAGPQPSRTGSKSEQPGYDGTKGIKPPRQRGQGSVDSSTEPGLKAVAPQQPRPASPPPPTRQTSNPISRRSSQRNSQTVVLLKELDAARNRNAWYASELELARKSGYVPNASLSPVLESRGADSFDDDDKPLLEALLAMRTELANVQNSVDTQAVLAAKQIAEAEKQRDAAIQEAVYAKARFAAHAGSASSLQQFDNERDRSDRTDVINRKLADALNSQKHFQNQLERMTAEAEAEKRARKLADDTVTAAQRRMADLETYKQQNSSEVERLKAELHAAQRQARDAAAAATTAESAKQMIEMERNDFRLKLEDAVGSSKDHSTTFDSLRDAISASTEIKNVLERKLEGERVSREKAETRLNNLKVEHEAQATELMSVTQRLRDAEEMAERHAAEAKTHRLAVMSGLDKVAARDIGNTSRADADRIVALQGQLNAANALVKKYQDEVNAAADKLRGAEGRIAGLEAYQEQASREGVSIRRTLQGALKDVQSLQAHNSDLKNQLANQQLETNAMTVQLTTLKDILVERGISPTPAARARSNGSPRNNSPEASRIRDLEQELSTAHAAHEETKTIAAREANESEIAYREKLTQLENDYQSAVHYVKGTEKMLKQLKEQLSKYKGENARLKNEILELEDKGAAAQEAPSTWESERGALSKRVESLQAEMNTSKQHLEKQLAAIRSELDDAKRQRDTAVKTSEEAHSRLTTSRSDLQQLQQENALLERRAQDAEHKVGMLLDQVESSVDNYRRRSRQIPSMTSDQLKDIPAGAGAGPGAAGNSTAPAVGSGLNGQGSHVRQESSDAGSVYGTMSDARNSAALDSLANELETLRSHWEATNKNYRLSNTFDFDSNVTGVTSPGGMRKDGKEADVGLSESLADWRKRLDD